MNSLPARLRKFGFVLALIVVCAFVEQPLLAAENGGADVGSFISGFEDLPLMPGLTQVPDAGTMFDTPSGRVVEAYAKGKVAVAEVAAFYDKTLPHLGWKKVTARRYRREGEVLDLEISDGQGSDDRSTTVRFYLAPNAIP
jgi:hypothetical protein